MRWGPEPLPEEAAPSGTTLRLARDRPSVPPALAMEVVGQDRRLLISPGFKIGRAHENGLVLDDPGVSALHCLLRRSEEAWLLYDCQSTNGTFLNGARIACGEVQVGAHIAVGSTELRIAGTAEATAATPAPAGQASRTSLAARLGIVGRSGALEALLAKLERVAATRLGVLVLGESGTGKELIARALHELSPRAPRPFIAVNCSAIPAELADSELFGHERGAFTGALAARPGLFEQAGAGTLFLDEVGDLPRPLQPKLLRALETACVRRVGGRGETRVDVRVVSATNRELGPSEFRRDLYHRLAQVTLELPPLRERPSDIPLLIDHFLAERAPDGSAYRLEPGALAALCAYEWPGNIRELRNAVERAVLLCGPVLRAVDLLPPAAAPGPRRSTTSSTSEDLAALFGNRTLAEIEREVIAAALRRTGGNRRAAAQLLGLPRTTLGERIKRYGI